MSERRAFSLLEVMAALGIAAVLITALMNIVVDAENTGRRTRVRADIGNNGTILGAQLRRDLSVAGVGVPSAKNVTTNSDIIYASVIVATPTEVGIVGDLPRPDSNYSTFGLIDDRPAVFQKNQHVAWHTESDGGCIPQTSAGSCATGATSLFFPGENGCATTADALDRTCPWGLRRLRGAEPFQVVAGNRQWFSATNNPTLTVDDVGVNQALMVNTGSTFPASWANDGAGSLPNAGAGQGWVTTVDRVFYRFVASSRTIERIQCWGVPDPDHAAWPPATTAAAPTTPCAAPFEGMAAWETLANNVDSLAFTYFDSAGASVTTVDTAAKKASIRRVEFKITFRKDISGGSVRHEVVGGSFLSMIL